MRERKLYEGRPGISRMAGWAFAVFVLLLAALIGAILLPQGAPVWQGIALAVPALLALVVFLIRWFSWMLSKVVLTDKRVILSHGLLSRSVREIPVEKVQAVTLRQSLIGRLFGVGSVLIDSGGEGALSTEVIESLPKVRAFKEALESVLYRA